ncbi:MAG: hypothetical protein AB7L90_03390 [Hyphomicrobiaceae bacterium]
MDTNEFLRERQKTSSSTVQLSVEDVEILSRLMVELREATLSQATYLAATNFLKRFGFDVDGSALVRMEPVH